MFKNINVKFAHYRVPMKGMEMERWSRKRGWFNLGLNDNGVKPEPKGGKTICNIVLENEGQSIVFTAQSVCSMNDTFNYKIGRDIAYGRAQKSLVEYLKKGE